MQGQWSFVSNHSLVLTALYQNPDARQRDIADTVGITQGAVQRILHDLAASCHVSVERIGRRNRYRVNPQAPMRHPRLEGVEVGDLLGVLAGAPQTEHAA